MLSSDLLIPENTLLTNTTDGSQRFPPALPVMFDAAYDTDVLSITLHINTDTPQFIV